MGPIRATKILILLVRRHDASTVRRDSGASGREVLTRVKSAGQNLRNSAPRRREGALIVGCTQEVRCFGVAVPSVTLRQYQQRRRWSKDGDGAGPTMVRPAGAVLAEPAPELPSST